MERLDNFLATNIYEADGVTTDFLFSFAGVRPDDAFGTKPYIDESDIFCQEVYDTEDGPEVIPRDLVLLAVNAVRVVGDPIAAGRRVKIYRRTEPRFPLVDYKDLQVVSEADLDLANRQNVFLAQEAFDESTGADARSGVAEAVAQAIRAAQAAQEAAQEATDAATAAQAAIETIAEAIGWRLLPKATFPDTRDDGSDLRSGDFFYHTEHQINYTWNGNEWRVSGGGALPEWSPKDYAEEYANSTQGTRGGYYEDSVEEVKALYNGGFDGDTWGRVLPSPIIGETRIRIAGLDAYVNRPLPIKSHFPQTWPLPLQGINSTLQDTAVTPVNWNLLDPFYIAYTKFRFMGKHKLHALLRGSLKLWVRAIDSNEHAYRVAGRRVPEIGTFWLKLTMHDESFDESVVSYNIGVYNGGWKHTPLFKTAAYAALQPGRPDFGTTYPDGTTFWQRIASGEVAVTPEDGLIWSNSIAEDLDEEQEALTTNWIPTLGHTQAAIMLDAVSTVHRFQYRDKYGQVWYDSVNSQRGDEWTERLYNLPADAVEFRVCYAQLDEVPNITIRMVPYDLDPLHGSWAEVDINVSALVHFEPGVSYSLELQQFDAVFAERTTQGIIVHSGGLAFLENFRQPLQEKYPDVHKDDV